MQVKVLKSAMLPSNLEKYSDDLGSVKYVADDVLINVDNKYYDRFAKYPEHFEIFDYTKPKKTKKEIGTDGE